MKAFECKPGNLPEDIITYQSQWIHIGLKKKSLYPFIIGDTKEEAEGYEFVFNPDDGIIPSSHNFAERVFTYKKDIFGKEVNTLNFGGR